MMLENKAFREFLAVHELFRRWEFDAKSIFCVVAKGPRERGLCCFCELRVEGWRFAVNCGPIGTDADSFLKLAQGGMVAVNDGTVSSAALNELWAQSLARGQAIFVRAALVDKGIAIPRETRRFGESEVSN